MVRASHLAAVALLALPSIAEAQTVTTAPARPHGAELSLRLGAGTFTDSSSTPFSSATASVLYSTLLAGVGFQIDLGYRLHPRVAVGARLGLQRLSAHGDNAANGTLTVGVYGRYVIPLVQSFRHEFWVGLGVDVYSSFTRSLTPTGMALMKQEFNALSLPLHVGIDFGINSHLSIGPVVSASLWIPYERCVSGRDGSTGAFTNECHVDPGSVPNVLLFVGVNIRLHP